MKNKQNHFRVKKSEIIKKTDKMKIQLKTKLKTDPKQKIMFKNVCLNVWSQILLNMSNKRSPESHRTLGK